MNFLMKKVILRDETDQESFQSQNVSNKTLYFDYFNILYAL